MKENAAPLMLSVSGLRGIVGETLTPDVAARFAAAFGSWLREQSPSPSGGGWVGESTDAANADIQVESSTSDIPSPNPSRGERGLQSASTPHPSPLAPPLVVIGRDSRPSGELLEMAAAAGLAAVGCRVVRLGVVSTPGVAVMADHLDAAGGLVVTASHNPAQWNGIKLLIRQGAAARQPLNTPHPTPHTPSSPAPRRPRSPGRSSNDSSQTPSRGLA